MFSVGQIVRIREVNISGLPEWSLGRDAEITEVYSEASQLTYVIAIYNIDDSGLSMGWMAYEQSLTADPIDALIEALDGF